MLAEHGEESRLYAGGTALLLGMRQRMLAPSHIVYLGGVPGLNRIEFDARDGLRIGALARHADVADSPLVRERYPVLAAMAGQVADPQIRNMGTLGGNLCYGDPATDPPGCLMALRARAIALSKRGERVIELDDFFTDYYQTALQPDEVVTEIRVPPVASNAVAAYTRFLRTAAEHRPLVGFAVVASVESNVCRGARIVVAASTPVPTRARKAEDFLEDKGIDAETIEEAARIASEEVSIVSDFRGSAEYRRDMVRVVGRRTMACAFGIAQA